MTCIQKLMARGYTRSQARTKCEQARSNNSHLPDDSDDLLDIALAVYIAESVLDGSNSCYSAEPSDSATSFDSDYSSESCDSDSGD